MAGFPAGDGAVVVNPLLFDFEVAAAEEDTAGGAAEEATAGGAEEEDADTAGGAEEDEDTAGGPRRRVTASSCACES